MRITLAFDREFEPPSDCPYADENRRSEYEAAYRVAWQYVADNSHYEITGDGTLRGGEVVKAAPTELGLVSEAAVAGCEDGSTVANQCYFERVREGLEQFFAVPHPQVASSLIDEASDFYREASSDSDFSNPIDWAFLVGPLSEDEIEFAKRQVLGLGFHSVQVTSDEESPGHMALWLVENRIHGMESFVNRVLEIETLAVASGFELIEWAVRETDG